MEILLFIILLVLVLVLATINIFLFYKNLQQIQKPKEVEKKPRLTKEEKDKQKEIKKAFDNLMNYDENAARKRRK